MKTETNLTGCQRTEVKVWHDYMSMLTHVHGYTGMEKTQGTTLQVAMHKLRTTIKIRLKSTNMKKKK